MAAAAVASPAGGGGPGGHGRASADQAEQQGREHVRVGGGSGRDGPRDRDVGDGDGGGRGKDGPVIIAERHVGSAAHFAPKHGAYVRQSNPSPIGQCITLADRLAEIAERYAAEHLDVRCLQRAHDHLASTVERTEERMWAAGVRD
jgi:hypothetical protein